MELTVKRPSVVLLPQNEQTKREAAFDRGMRDLMEAMDELFLVEKMTGRTGLPQRVCLAFSDALMSAMRLSDEKTGRCSNGKAH